MLQRSGADLPHGWVVGDDECGRASEFRAWLRQRQERSVLDVPCNTTVRDLDGREWVMGPANGRWYRRERDRWTEASPPRRLVCPACGHHNLQRHSFCTECGGRLPRGD